MNKQAIFFLSIVCILGLTGCERHTDNTINSQGSAYNSGATTNTTDQNTSNNIPPNPPANSIPTNTPTDIKSNPYK